MEGFQVLFKGANSSVQETGGVLVPLLDPARVMGGELVIDTRNLGSPRFL